MASSSSSSISSSASSRSTRQSGRSLSELAGQQDAEPYVPPADGMLFDFLVELAEDDEAFNMAAEVSATEEFFAGFTEADIADVLDAFLLDAIPTNNGRMVDDYNEIRPVDIPQGVQPARPMPVFPSSGELGYLHIKDQDNKRCLCYNADGQDFVVGTCSDHITLARVDYRAFDPFILANRYAEEVGGIGANMGYSAFYHSAVIMSLAEMFGGIVEPFDGGDYAVGGISFEVTGDNYLLRSTNCDIVINKYFYHHAIHSKCPYHDDYSTLSWQEDKGLANGFLNTAFDVVSTDRSTIVRQLSSCMSNMTADQRDALGQNYTAFLADQKPYTPEDIPVNRDFSLVRDELLLCIKEGCKERNGSLFAPSPFKVLYPQVPHILNNSQIEARRNLFVPTKSYGHSTYHTWPHDKDPYAVVGETVQYYPEHNVKEFDTFQDALYSSFLKYKIFQSAHICGSLYSKINHKSGSYYDDYLLMGIAWHRQRASSLTWDINFYCYENPGLEEEVGKWSYNESLGVYVSPSSKVSRQCIHYAVILTTKVAAMLSAVRPLVNPGIYKVSEKKIMCAMAGMIHSTWMTSYRAGCCRFLTCCHISESGDTPSLIMGQLGASSQLGGKYHRFCDYFILSRYLKYIDESPAANVTPLFRLPFHLMSIEKDYTQTLQWHMRKTDHDTKCMIKVTEAAKRHALEYEATNLWLMKQLEYIKKFMHEGSTYDEYADIMDSAPEFPTMNILSFMGMCNIMKEDFNKVHGIDSGLGYSVWGMMTDRHCTEYKAGTTPQLKSSRVVEALTNHLMETKPHSGAYEMLVKLKSGSKLPPNYLLNHSKDAKEADREISQMMPQHRIKQNFTEALAQTFTGSNEADQMTDLMKYTNHVVDTMEFSSTGRCVHFSEDRSKFCQEMEPQLQALGVLAIGLEGGSTCMISSAAMGLTNVQRKIVYPPDADREFLIGDMDRETILVEQKGETKKTSCITIEKNMTQGLGAIHGACINTVHVVASNRAAAMIIPGVVNHVVRTTSDDVKRSFSIAPEYNYSSVAANAYLLPNRDLAFSMMKDNTKKPIISAKLSEFNNVVASTTGMIPQSPIFATLCVQPLLSKSIFGDLSELVNKARSTLSWGCPPDSVEACLQGLLRVLRTKWLMTSSELYLLYDYGLIPKSMSELIEGFWVRNDHTAKLIFSLFDDDMKKDVLIGNVPLGDMMRRMEVDIGRKKKKKKTKHVHIDGLDRANKVAETIHAQRLVSERLMSRHIQPIHHTARLKTKQKFFAFLSQPTPDVDISDLKRLAPPRVTTISTPAHMRHRKPCSMGTSGLVPTMSLQRIRAFRKVGVNFRTNLSDEEMRIAKLPDEEYEKEVAVLERAKRIEGLSFKSPCGLPFTRIYDGKVFRRNAVFNFRVELTQKDEPDMKFTYKGIVVQFFKPCIWGGESLSRIPPADCIIAFGYGTMRGEKCIFFKKKKKNSPINYLTVPNQSRGFVKVPYFDSFVYAVLGIDKSPILTRHHKSKIQPSLAGFIGDNDAIFNYGMYCRSNSIGGFAVYQDLFKSYFSVIPFFVKDYLPTYPKFFTGSKLFNAARVNVLEGNYCSHMLRLTEVEQPLDLSIFNLNGNEPALVAPLQVMNEEVEVDEDF